MVFWVLSRAVPSACRVCLVVCWCSVWSAGPRASFSEFASQTTFVRGQSARCLGSMSAKLAVRMQKRGSFLCGFAFRPLFGRRSGFASVLFVSPSPHRAPAAPGVPSSRCRRSSPSCPGAARCPAPRTTPVPGAAPFGPAGVQKIQKWKSRRKCAKSPRCT